MQPCGGGTFWISVQGCDEEAQGSPHNLANEDGSCGKNHRSVVPAASNTNFLILQKFSKLKHLKFFKILTLWQHFSKFSKNFGNFKLKCFQTFLKFQQNIFKIFPKIR